MTKRDIPEIRDRLFEIAEELLENGFNNFDATALGEEIGQLAHETKREPPTRPRAPVKSRALDASEREAVRTCAANNPELHISEIATMFGTNPGRISEALKEKDKSQK